MFRKSTFVLLALVLSLVAVVPAYAKAGKPTFGPALYADGQVWGTKAAAILPAPNGNNLQSFDGGRWFTQTVMWTEAGFEAHGTVPVLTSSAEVMLHASLGHLTITPGSFEGGPPAYFECPLLPVK